VVVINPTQKIVTMSVISQPTDAIAKLNTIVKIRKYRGLHEGHHFILMVMEVHDAPRRDMDCLLRSVFIFSMIDN